MHLYPPIIANYPFTNNSPTIPNAAAPFHSTHTHTHSNTHHRKNRKSKKYQKLNKTTKKKLMHFFVHSAHARHSKKAPRVSQGAHKTHSHMHRVVPVKFLIFFTLFFKETMGEGALGMGLNGGNNDGIMMHSQARDIHTRRADHRESYPWQFQSNVGYGEME